MSATPRWQGTQRRIGLTGGIASGKSSVGSHLAELGLPVLDADIYAHEVLAPGSPGNTLVYQRYGPTIAEPINPAQRATEQDRSINRIALGQIVFNDPEERQWLEQLIHPLVRRRFEAELARLRHEPRVVLMIPLLFEARLDGLCSEIWVVHCEKEQQMERLMARDGLSVQDAARRIHAQWPLRKKCQHADRVIDNSGNPEAFKEVLETLIRHI
ncbi:dephospho-CoA kinase [Synechococcus sp. MIT S9508]|uniref:dephospho-CoA kinase n=1 Tax=Synechococcus sp. MIT S9508 TaxID=1801629 RepID=UPI001E53B225|nr:dephospho-CoA kinase [Synechococcus sp. MIT S9508]